MLSPEATPSLRRLFLEVVSNSLLERLDDIFGVPQVRKLTTLGIQSWDNGGIRLAEFRNLLNKTPNLLLPVCMGGFGDLGVVLPRLIHNLVIRQLSISVPESVWDIQFSEGVLFDNFRVILMTMENLEALWVASCAGGRKFSSFSEDEMRHLRGTIVCKIAALCPRLKYLRIDHLSWRIRRCGENGRKIRARVLKARDDELECPRAFRTPDPLTGHELSWHADW